MKIIKQEKNEDRKIYLLRVAIAFLEGDDTDGIIKYDNAECDSSCLAEDIKIEFDLTPPNNQ